MTDAVCNDTDDGFRSSGSSPPASSGTLVDKRSSTGTDVGGFGQSTKAVRTGIASDHQHGAVVPPIHLSANFTFAGFGQKRTYDYTRSGNPTRDHLAEALATLEEGVGGIVTSSGMSAVLLVTSVLRRGDVLVAPHDCYGGTYRLFKSLAEKGHFDLVLVDETDSAALERALQRRPRLVWVETPSNPLLRITDVRELARRAHAVGAWVVADNTFLSPILQRPLTLGADLVVHSTTKYINGHSDVVGGAVIASTPAQLEELNFWANCLGLTGAPFDSYLTLRGLRTLHARMACHQRNAAAVVQVLCNHPAVQHVYHPSLPHHAGHAIARVQQSGFGAMVSFELKGGTDQVQTFLSSLQCFSLAESLGGVESLVAHPATMTHASMDAQAREHAGIKDTLVRLSVGIETTEDLTRDIAQALDRAQGKRLSPLPIS